MKRQGVDTSPSPVVDWDTDSETEKPSLCCLQGCISVTVVGVSFFVGLPTGILLVVLALNNDDDSTLMAIGIVLIILPIIMLIIVLILCFNQKRLPNLVFWKKKPQAPQAKPPPSSRTNGPTTTTISTLPHRSSHQMTSSTTSCPHHNPPPPHTLPPIVQQVDYNSNHDPLHKNGLRHDSRGKNIQNHGFTIRNENGTRLASQEYGEGDSFPPHDKVPDEINDTESSTTQEFRFAKSPKNVQISVL